MAFQDGLGSGPLLSETGATLASTFSFDEHLPEHGDSEILCDDEVRPLRSLHVRCHVLCSAPSISH